MKKVLIFQGGWDGHEPKLTSARFARMMEEAGYAAEVHDTQDCLADAEKLMVTSKNSPHHIEKIAKCCIIKANEVRR